MNAPGPGNAITDVAGIGVGHAHRLDAEATVAAPDGSAAGAGWATGTTVVRAAGEGAVAAVDVRGGGPGTRETDLLDPAHTVQRAHAVVLTGGSAYGLAAADGAMRRLEEDGAGIPMDPAGRTVPIVPAAVIFDLPVGGWRNRPDAAFGRAATAAAGGGFAGSGVAAGDPVAAGGTAAGGAAVGAPDGLTVLGGTARGSIGAGVGARAGALKGGVGGASVVVDGGPAHGITVGALVVANPVGSVVDPADGLPWGAAAGLAGEFAALRPPPGAAARARLAALAAKGTVLNTTIGVVATDAALSAAACRRLATAAHDGLARAVRPAHSPLDGDTIFALATGRARALAAEDAAALVPAAMPGELPLLAALCGPAADCVERAIVHAVLAAAPVAGIPAYTDVIGRAGARA